MQLCRVKTTTTTTTTNNTITTSTTTTTTTTKCNTYIVVHEISAVMSNAIG